MVDFKPFTGQKWWSYSYFCIWILITVKCKIMLQRQGSKYRECVSLLDSKQQDLPHG